MGKKEKQFSVRLTETDQEELEAVAQKLDVPVAQIAREGIRDRVAELKRQLASKSQEATANS